MALQYYKIKATGEMYSLDKGTGRAVLVTTIPAGSAVITWVGKDLPSELQVALSRPVPVVTPGETRQVTLPNGQIVTINDRGDIVSGPPAVPVPTVGGNITAPVTGKKFQETNEYKSLPPESKDFVDIAYNLIEVGGEAEAKFFANAVAQAQAIADPYYKTQLSLAGAEVLGAIAEKNNDFETRKEVIERVRDELMQDVSSNKEFLTLEQQADISRNIRQYDEDLLTIADEAAEKGLTFATGARSRALAESRRGEQFQDVIQSGQRRFNFQIKELELKAARGDTSAQKELEALTGQKGFALQQIGRAAEEVLGSANVPAIPGFTPTGSALGKIEEEKRRTTISDVSGFLNLQKGFI